MFLLMTGAWNFIAKYANCTHRHRFHHRHDVMMVVVVYGL